MPAQSGDKIYAERSGIPGLLTAQEIADLKEAATVAQGILADNSVQKTGDETIDGVKSFLKNINCLGRYRQNSASTNIIEYLLSGIRRYYHGYIPDVGFRIRNEFSNKDLHLLDNGDLEYTGDIIATNFIGSGAGLTGVATAAQGTKADSAVQSLQAGTNITIDNTDPQSPIISSTASSGSGSSIPEAPSDNDSYARRNSEWIAIPRFLTYIKSATEIKTSNNVYATDSDLISEDLLPNALYRLEIMLITQSDAATDFTFRVIRTGLADADLRYTGDLDNAAAATSTWNTNQNVAGAGATANPRMGNYIGMIDTGSNTGNIAIQWRQQTSGVGQTKLLRGSMLILRRVQ